MTWRIGLSQSPPGLRFKVTLGIVIPLILILGAFTAIEHGRHRQVVLDTAAALAANSGQILGVNLRHALRVADPEAMQAMLDTMDRDASIRMVRVLNANGVVVAAPEARGVGTRLDYGQADCQPCHDLEPGERPLSVIVTDATGQQVARSTQPLENGPDCVACHDPGQRLLGLVQMDLAVVPLAAPLLADLQENVVWWLGTILVTVLIVNIVTGSVVLRPLDRLLVALAGFDQDTAGTRVAEKSHDELGRLDAAFNAMARGIESRTAENRALARRLERQNAQRGELLRRTIHAQEAERKRVARELHDELGQVFGGLSLNMQAVSHVLGTDNDRARQQLQQTQTLVQRGVNRMYDLIHDLRPPELDDLGLVAALRHYADRLLKESDIELTLEASALPDRLESNIETILYRVFQEAMSNVVRHAGASRLDLRLTALQGQFDGEIRDNGRGFDLSSLQLNGRHPRGLGILGMEERLMHCGGRLDIDTRPNQGTCVRVRIPLSENGCG